jgi:YegS/Rv2252/BmrU family lipid kinase
VNEREGEPVLRVRILFNPISGGRRRPADDIATLEAIFAKYGVQPELICLQERWQATDLARGAVAEGIEMVVVVGGDGTINEAVCGLVSTDTLLGIIPAGSGNGISRELGIPRHLEKACQVILEGKTQPVDVGCLNGRFFLGTAGIGYDAMVGYVFDQRWGGQRGMWPYIMCAFSGFFKYRPKPLRLCMTDRVLDVSPLLVTAANTAQYGGGAIISPQAKPNDGLLDVCVIHDMNFFQALYHWPKLFTGRIDTMPQWDMYRTESLEILSEHPVPVHVDGEPVGVSAHIRVKLIPAGVLVRIPQTVTW